MNIILGMLEGSKGEAFAAGTRIFSAGDAGNVMFLVLEGEVELHIANGIVETVGPGEPFGEMAYLSKNGHVRGADVTVSTDANIISVPTPRLKQASEACRHKFDRAFMEILVERLSNANLRLSGV